jgi:hypothetical protein
MSAPQSIKAPKSLKRGEDRSTSLSGNERGKDVRTSNIVAAKGFFDTMCTIMYT